MKMTRAAAIAAICLVGAGGTFGAEAQTAAATTAAAATGAASGKLYVQLNKADTGDKGCNVTFVLSNQTTTAIKTIGYTMSLFDTSGQLIQPVKVSFPAMPVGRTKAIQFTLGMTCDKIQGMLPETTDCVAADGTPSTVCDDDIVLSTKTTIQFPWQLDIK
jgi:hypothetical protein